MKAVVCMSSGKPEVLKVIDVAIPEPSFNEVLIKVHYSTATRGDVVMRKIPKFLLSIVGALFGFKPMKITGVEYAGVIVKVGNGVTKFKTGDTVCGTATGLTYGGNAEFLCVPEQPRNGVIVHKPEGVSFSSAAALPVGGMTALFLLKKAGSLAGKDVMIYGASGSVGTFAVQLAKHFGAKVTGVCSRANLELVKSLGADSVIDYTTKDIDNSKVVFDCIFDAVGKVKKSRFKSLLHKNGVYLSVKSPTKEVAENLQFLIDLLADKKLEVVIDREHRLDEIVEAHTYVETGKKRGNVLIRVSN